MEPAQAESGQQPKKSNDAANTANDASVDGDPVSEECTANVPVEECTTSAQVEQFTTDITSTTDVPSSTDVRVEQPTRSTEGEDITDGEDNKSKWKDRLRPRRKKEVAEDVLLKDGDM